MSAPSCPNCEFPLSAENVASGWCEACGKKIPEWVVNQQQAPHYQADAGPAQTWTPPSYDRPAAPPTDLPTPPAGSARFWAIVLAVPFLVALFAFLLAEVVEGWVWKITAGIGGVLLGLTLLYAVPATFKGEHDAPGAKGWGIIAYCLVLWFLWFGIGYPLQKDYVTIHVDNFSSHNVALELDGKPWLEIRRGDKQEVRLEPIADHAYELVVKEAGTGKELDRQTLQMKEKKPYILNILAAHTYYRGSVDYGMSFRFGLGGPGYREVKDVWICADVDYLFQEPPDTISVSKHTMTATRTYLIRQRPTKN